MNDMTRERLLRSIDALPDAQLYQALDYVEFLAKKYAASAVRPPSSELQRFGERLENRLRARRVGFQALRGTLDVVSTADRVVGEFVQSGRAVAREIENELVGNRESGTGD